MAPLSNVEIKEIGKNLSSAAAENRSGDARKLLEKLQTGVNASEEVIRATKIGQVVAKLRASDDKAVAQAAKDLVRSWKSKVESQRGARKVDSPSASGSASPSNGLSAEPSPISSLKAGKQNLDFEVLGERTRNACLKLIYQSLNQNEEGIEERTAYECALKVEAAVLEKIGQGEVTGEYRAKVRSLTLNLKDKKNPSLRRDVVNGRIKANHLVTMSADELASEEQKAERNALQMQNLFNAKGAAAQEAETDAFECGRCKQRKCRYYQKQTRSADEPMTTFVTCTNCNHKWKFC